MKKIVLYVASALVMFAQARDTNRYDRVEVREGFEFSQRGGLGTSDEVVTAVSLPTVASNLAEGANFIPFSNAVEKVVPPVVHPAETDPFVSSWARKSGTLDPAKPIFSVTTNGTTATVTDGTLTLVEQDPQLSSWARKINGQDATMPITDISGKQDNLPYPTNDIPRSTIRGLSLSPKRLGQYLWEISTEGEDWTAATSLYASWYPDPPSAGIGIATAGFHGRNLDRYYDRKATTVVRVPAKDGRFGLVGFSSGIVDDEVLESGTHTNLLDVLSFSLSDGMNDKGVVIQMDVIPKSLLANHRWHTLSPTKIVVSAIVRKALESCVSAVDAVTYLITKTYVPASFPFDVHFLVSDGSSAYVIEDGISTVIRGWGSFPVVMSNHRMEYENYVSETDGLVNWTKVILKDPYGRGLERSDLVTTNGLDKNTLDGMIGTVKGTWYSKAYDQYMFPYWWTEHCILNDRTRSVSVIKNGIQIDTPLYFERTLWSFLYASEHVRSSSQYRGGQSISTSYSSVYDRGALCVYLLNQEGEEIRRFDVVANTPGATLYDVQSEISRFSSTGSVVSIVSGDSEILPDRRWPHMGPDSTIHADSMRVFQDIDAISPHWSEAVSPTINDTNKFWSVITTDYSGESDCDYEFYRLYLWKDSLGTLYVSITNFYGDFGPGESISDPGCADLDPTAMHDIGFGMFSVDRDSLVTAEELSVYDSRESFLSNNFSTVGISAVVITNGASFTVPGNIVTNMLSVETPNDVFYDGTRLVTRSGTEISVSGDWLPANTNVNSETLRFGLGKLGRTALWKADAVYVCETNVYVESVTTNTVTVIDGTNVVYHPEHTEYSYSTNVVTHVETNVVVVLGTNVVDRTLGGIDSMVDGRGVISLGDDGRMTARSEAAMYDEAATNRGSAVSAAFARAVAANVGDDVLNSSDVNLTKTLGSGMLVGEFRVKSVRYELRIPKDLVHLVTPGEEKDLVARENGRTYLFGSSSVSGSQDYIRLGNGAFMWLRSLDDVWVGGSNSSTNSRGQATSVVHGALRMSTHLVHLVDSLIAATPRVIHAAQTNDQWFVDMKASALNSVQHGSDGFVAVSNAAMRSLSNYPDRIYDTSIRWDSPEWSSTGYVHTVLSDGKMEVKAYGWDPVPETVYYTSNRVGSASTEYPEFLLYRGHPTGMKIGGSYGYYYYTVSNLVYRHVLGTSEYEYDDAETKRTATCLSEGYGDNSFWYREIPWSGIPTVDPVVTSYLFSATSTAFPKVPRVRVSDFKFYNMSMGTINYSTWGQTYVLNGQWGPLHVPKHSGTEAELLAAANSGGHVTVGSVEYIFPNYNVSPLNSFGYYFDKSIGGGSGDHMGSSWEVHTNYHEYVVSLRSVTTNSFVTVPSSAVPQSWSSYSVDSAVLNGKVILMLKEGN